MKISSTYNLLFVFLGICLSSPSQNQQLRSYNLEDGLPQSQVFDMVQDDRGYLWLATQGGGLARFDGKDFEIYNKTNGLKNNYVNALLTSNDSLFIGTNRGLSVKVKHHFYAMETPQIHNIKKVNGGIYLLTNQGVYKVSADLKVKKLLLNKTLDASRINDLIYENGYFWIASSEGFFKVKDINNAEPVLQQMVTDDFVSLLKFENKLFAATANGGMLIFKPDHFDEAILTMETFRINHLSVQNKDEVWVATDDAGIFRLDLNTYDPVLIIDSNQGLAVPNVQKVLKDRQANIWIATSGGGFYKYFQNNFKHYDTSTGLLGNRVYAVHFNENAVWVSHSETGISKIDKNGIHSIETPEAFKGVKLKTISSDQNGNIWMGSDGRGIWLREKKTRDSILEDKSKISELSKIRIPITTTTDHTIDEESGFPFEWIRSIQTQNDTIWAATYSSGIVKFTFNTSTEKVKVHQVFSSAEGISDLQIKQTLLHNQKLWYATQNGHLGYIQNNKVAHLGAVLDEDVAINSILINNNSMFLGTAGRGIWWSDMEGQLNFKKLKGAKPLTSENCLQLIFDGEGFLWLGTERGVDKIDLSADTEILDVFNFGRNDGFLGIETTLNAIDKDKKGHLWFGTINGLTEFIPAENDSKSLKPDLFFNDVKVAYKSVDSIDLKVWTNSNKILKLQPDQRQISFNYKSVDLDHPNTIEYRTKLNATDWSPWSTSSSTNFSGLAFGNHTFSVQSRNYRWQHSETKQFSFFIERPLYKKAWFQWVVLLLVLLALVLFITSYIKRLKQKNRAAQDRLKMENHLLDLEQKALRLQMNPHFMFNVLNGIKALAKTKPDVMNVTINNFAALLRETLINSRKESISLQEEMNTLHHYIKLEQSMTSKVFDYEITLESDFAADEIQIPPMLIQPFVENAIRHGILKAPRDGKLNIKFCTSETFLHINITDNGVGIYKSQQQKTNSGHQSMALKVTEERLESISGKNTLRISELKETDGSVIGTQIEFKIPLETDY